MMKYYHIYLEDKCLFKNLNQEEFDVGIKYTNPTGQRI